MRRLKILGCGDAFANGGRHTTSFLVHQEGKGFLIDCGASTLVRLKQEGFSVKNINTIFISHFHGDHYGGLPFILISMKFEIEESHKLTIIGPSGIKERTRILQESMYPGTGVLVEELNIEFIEYDKSMQKIEDISFQAYSVTHSPPSIPHGIKVIWENKSLAFSGDTEWDDNLIELSNDTEVFITECNNLDIDSPGHLSLRTLTKKFTTLNTRKILLSHMGPKMLSEQVSENFIKLKDGLEMDLW